MRSQARTERIVSEYGAESDRAETLLRRTDKERRENCLHYTGCEWGNCHYYHLMLDSSTGNYEKIVEAICGFLGYNRPA